VTQAARRVTKFERLARTHAAMAAGEASLVVALADSFFFDVDPDTARSKVLLFLLVSFAPFLLVAPLIGPLIDRIRGGRRLIVQLVALTRIVLQLMMIAAADELLLFPLVFAALVLQKSYLVSKQALVPSVVPTDRDLVEANAKLGVIAGVTGFVAVLPALVLQVSLGTPATLVYGAILFGIAFVTALALPRERAVVAPAGAEERRELASSAIRSAAAAMAVLRACVGFTLFHLAFWLRSEDAGTAWFALAVVMSSLGSMAGNWIGPLVRTRVREEDMVLAALAVPAIVGLVAAFLGGPAAGVVLAVAVNFAAALGRLAFESIVQRDAPSADRGRAFARFETRFQLGWVAAAVVPVVLTFPGWLGFAIVGVACAVAVVRYWPTEHRAAARRSISRP
jgi:Major Facilitator Superfamily